MQTEESGPGAGGSGLDYFKKALNIIKLHEPAMAEVAQDPNALRFGIPVTAIGGALAFIPGKTVGAVFVGAIFSVFVLYLFAAFVHLFCGYSKGKQQFVGFLRVVAVAGILDWAVIVPYADLVIAIWSIVVSIAAARTVYELSQRRAIFTVLISAMILWIVTLMVFTGPLSSLYNPK